MKRKTFSGGMRDLEAIGKFVSHAARQAGLSEEEIYDLELAVDEACTNIIEHGYQCQGDQNITCICENVPRGIKITLQDSSCAFDPRSVPEPSLGKRLEDVRQRGVGVYLIRRLMDEVLYNYNPREGNTLILIKRRHA